MEQKISSNIEALHRAASRLNTEQLVSVLYALYYSKDPVADPRAIVIMKTYLARALQREGIPL